MAHRIQVRERDRLRLLASSPRYRLRADHDLRQANVEPMASAFSSAVSGDVVWMKSVWHLLGMKPLFVRELSDPERHALQAGLRSSDGFTVRRCHILLASARGDTAPVIAQAVRGSPQAVRNVLRALESPGLAGVGPPMPPPPPARQGLGT